MVQALPRPDVVGPAMSWTPHLVAPELSVCQIEVIMLARDLRRPECSIRIFDDRDGLREN